MRLIDVAEAEPAASARSEPAAVAWLFAPLSWALAAVVAFGLVGLVLADVGAFTPLLVGPLGAVATICLHGRRRPRSARGATRSAQLAAGAAAAVAIGFGIVSIRYAAQHVLIDRDAGAYVNTGRWLAGHRSLAFRADIGAFRGTPGLSYHSPAVYGHGPAMHFQFAHLLGVLLAEAHWVGGDALMFAFVPILGALALALFYLVAARFVRPFVALVATTALACNVVQLHFARDAYSEILLQFLLLGSVAVLAEPGLDRRRAGFAGILLGATVAARIDGPLYLAGIAAIVAIAAARSSRARDDSDAPPLRVVGAFCAGVVTAVVLAIIDVVWRSPEYVRSLGARVVIEFAALLAAIALVAYLAPRTGRARERARAIRTLPAAIGGAVSICLLAGWLIRPYVQRMNGPALTLIGQLQRADHIAFDPHRHYYESSLRWLAWYLGPPALAAGIVGVAFLVRDILRHGRLPDWILLGAFAAASAVYLWDPNALPDQLWVTRRLVPVVIPGFVLGAAVLIDRLVRRPARTTAALAAALGIAMIAWPLSASAAVPTETTQAHVLGALRATCRAIGAHAAVVVVHGSDSFDRTAPQAIRSFCDTPVAIRKRSLTTAELESLARRFRAQGRTLYLVGDTPAHIDAVLPSARARTVATVVDRHELEQTLTKPPRKYWTKTYAFAVAKVP